MSREPYRSFSTAPASVVDERPGIFGMETEYAVLYLPHDPEDQRRPAFAEIESVIFGVLRTERKTACSSGLKGGYFLENGGLIHLEVFLRRQDDNSAILEAATPECRTPWDLLVYSRAYDHLLDTISRRSVEALAKIGFAGRIAFGKNNLDSHGVGYGSHENYLVHVKCTRSQTALYITALPFIAVTLVPTLTILVLALFLFGLAVLVTKLVPPLQGVAPRVREWLRKRGAMETLASVYYAATNVLLLPAVALYSLVVGRVAFRSLTTNLTPFLVSRQILAGTGALDFEHGVYEISQRPRLTRTTRTIIMFGRRKTIYDLKGFLYDPMSLFRPTKRFTLAVGDSNLSDIPTILKLGSTALMIEMIEAGETFGELRLRRPLRALKSVSRDGPWKQLPCRRGDPRTAVDIQWACLERVKKFFAGRPEKLVRHGEVIELWESVLRSLCDHPQSAQTRIDWLAKKSVLDQAIRLHTDWSQFFAWGRAFHAAGLDATNAADSVDDLVRHAPQRRRGTVKRLVREGGLVDDEFSIHHDLYFQARKIDLRYHEISDGQGYQRVLEAEGLIERLTDDVDVERATREPPRNTRARIRGYYIGISQSQDALQVNWDEIEFREPMRHISLPDPFYHHLPDDR